MANSFLDALRIAMQGVVTNNTKKDTKARTKEIVETMPHVSQYDAVIAPEDVTPPKYETQLIPTQSDAEVQLIPNGKEPLRWVEYTYQPGDNFSDILMYLGLSDGKNLWGKDGDVAYYTQQLAEQGALDSRGNIKVGSNIRLIKRGRPFDQPVLT